VLFEIGEMGEHVWISAFQSHCPNVTQLLADTSKKFPDTYTQLVDLDKVAGSRYLFVATYNALKSFNSKRRISRSLPMEILLYIAADRQIAEAIKHVGVSSETEKTAAIVLGHTREVVSAVGTYLTETIKHSPADSLLDEWTEKRTKNVRSALDIRDKELNAILRKGEDPVKGVERLAIERSALLTVRK